ncbi:preprotein translocase subunit YajC [Sphingomonas arenae]|uniref:preprotein translocase subunit YajC n=1 Tax=Sphingomonas arenae TaxID=2812555 RepID=UPI00196798FA|nr:preprotein translocase subunit YajC [Sphingomonas arenae]
MSSLYLTTAAAAGAAQAPGGATAFFVQIFPLLLIFIIFYFLLIRPQSRRMKQHREMLGALKKGDEVITGGGLRARVTRIIDDNDVEVEIAQGIKVRAVKSTITQVITPQSKPAND